MARINLTQTDHSVDHSLAMETSARLQLERGASVGRYVILDLVGEGGMGVVYSAFDPELDRKLALKLLRTASRDRRAERRRLRLIREAQAMARLSHPNVITVHDVGTIDDQVFVAMEFIEGCSLSEWIRRGHDWRQVVAIFIQAGEGLAAAHQAGLVHRDFKPDNVMLTIEQRAVVTDFGLARASGRGDASQSRDPEAVAGPPRASLSTTVTAAGAIMGTPAYMSPEQHEGREVDARSDQFAFAVALYEALYGQRPFPGDDVASLAYNVGVGNIRPPPSRTSVPNWLRQVLLRALSIDPADRFESMSPLLELLRKDRVVRGPWGKVVLGGIVLVGTGVGVAAALDDEAPCASGVQQVEAALGLDALRPARDAFEASALPYAREGWPAVEAAVTDYASAWSATYQHVCEATHVRHEQSQALLDARMNCLARRLDDADALVDLFASGESQALEHALDAVTSLSAANACESASAEDEPLDPEVATRVEALRPALSRVAALERTGMFTVGLEAARSLVDETLAVDHAPLQAEAHLRLASLQRTAGQHELAEFNYKESLSLALRGGADEVAAEAAVALVGMTGRAPHRAREAEGWSGVADALLARSAAPAEDRARLLSQRAELLEAAGRRDAARRPLREAASLLESAYGDDDVRVAEAWAALGRHSVRSGDLDAARPMLTRALAVVGANFGSDHPRTAALMHVLGEVEFIEGDFSAAGKFLREALAVREQQNDAGPRAQTLLLLARTNAAIGELDSAEKTLHIIAELEGVSPRTYGQALIELARLALRRGDAAAAIRRASHSRPTLDDAIALEQRWVLDAVIADALMRQGRTERARKLLDTTIEALEQRRGADAEALAEPLTIRGELLVRGDQPARALGPLERALALRPAIDPRGLARTEFALADALARVDAQSARALVLARRALTRLPPRDALRTDVEGWLEAREDG